MKMKTLEDVFLHALADAYSCEKQLTKALPKLAKASSNQELKEGFEDHLEETQKQVERIEQIVETCGLSLPRVKCGVIETLAEEAKMVIESMEAGPVRDVLLIAGAQKVEHFEMASYSTLIELAKQLEMDDAADLLEETLEEEKACDEKLNDIATSDVNEDAREAA